MLLNGFIHDRMVRDGILNAPVISDLQEPGTPCGKTVLASSSSAFDMMTMLNPQADGC